MRTMTYAEIKSEFDAAETTAKFIEALQRQGFEKDGDERIAYLAREVERRTERLLDLAGQIERKMKDITRWVGGKSIHGSSINSLGELQGTGPQFDIACALYSKAFEDLNGEIEARKRAENTSVAIGVALPLSREA